ncbi:hypothetical protein O3M35_001043 [Rhynocoris fuscipes]|uniref:MULE transposase domain-containing protein n=1 Tax=Rhynocoris fuscipes TaxID=488301 RepID=A0AAW1DQE8_9HEMI
MKTKIDLVLLAYFESTYITGVRGRDAVFPIRIWNHFEAAAAGLPRTTNCCEGYHNSLRALFHCSHPGVWDLLEGLKKDMAIHSKTLADADDGRPQPKRKKYETLNSKVIEAVQGALFEPQNIIPYLTLETNRAWCNVHNTFQFSRGLSLRRQKYIFENLELLYIAVTGDTPGGTCVK